MTDKFIPGSDPGDSCFRGSSLVLTVLVLSVLTVLILTVLTLLVLTVLLVLVILVVLFGHYNFLLGAMLRFFRLFAAEILCPVYVLLFR